MKLRSRGACLGGAQRELVQAAPLRVIQAAEQPRLKSDQHVAIQPHVGVCKSDSHLYARFISRWNYRFSSDQRSQAPLSSVSTGVGDQPGTLSDLAFLPTEVRGTRNSLVEPFTVSPKFCDRSVVS